MLQAMERVVGFKEIFYTVLALLCLSEQVQSYVLLQVSRDNQNRSNVDALIHKVVPSDQIDQFKKVARKQFSLGSRPELGYDKKEETLGEHQANSRSSELEETSVNKKIDETVRAFVKKKPVFKTQNFKISPEVVKFRTKPSLVYELDSSILIQAIKDFLSSSLVARYTDDAAQRAANFYTKFRSMNK